MQRAVAALTSYDVSTEKTVAMLFRDEDIAKAKAARGIVKPDYEIKGYRVAEHADLTIDYSRGANSCPIDPSRLHIQLDRFAPLAAFIGEVRDIYRKYEECVAMLKWLDANASPGAIRYYWPPILQVCPDAPAIAGMHEVPTRYLEPTGISHFLQRLRDTAATMAGSALIPQTVKPRLRSAMWLTLQPARVQDLDDPNGRAAFTTQQQTFNI